MSDAACRVSVIVPTHNPHPGRLARTVAGLAAQTLRAQWELIVVDNASTERAGLERLDLGWSRQARIVPEPQLGLTAARLCGFRHAHGELLVLVDDDNVLAPDYLAHVVTRFSGDPALGAAGGKSVPEFEAPPPAWAREFDPLLALRDLGEVPMVESWSTSAAVSKAHPRLYPRCAPIGAGMALRRTGARAYAAALESDPRRRAFDRSGGQLVSGGDNDIVMTILESGASVGYFPELTLTHLIPPGRSRPQYLGALNRAIAQSWVRVLALHGISPWPRVSRATVALRQTRAWLRARAWRGSAEWVRWQGLCGHFEGRAALAET